MDSQEADSPSTARRENVDFVKPIRDKESKWIHRKSLAWDTAFFTNPGVLDPEELFGSFKIDENEIDDIQVNSKHLPIAARPSFAWDKAFSTDPGVLDAEELSLLNNGFTSDTQLRKSYDSATQGSRFSVASIESDLFHDLRASLRNPPNGKKTVTVTPKIQRKLPDGKKMMTKGHKQRDQPLNLIPQRKVYSSLSSSSMISKPLTPIQAKPVKKYVSSSSSSISKHSTPIQAKPVKKSVASELGRNSGKHKSTLGFEEQSGSKSITRSSYSGYAVKDLTTSSSGMRLPLPKMGFFNSQQNRAKENREPNAAETARRRSHKSKLETSSTPENRSVLGQRKMRK